MASHAEHKFVHENRPAYHQQNLERFEILNEVNAIHSMQMNNLVILIVSHIASVVVSNTLLFVQVCKS
jgi:cytochrome b